MSSIHNGTSVSKPHNFTLHQFTGVAKISLTGNSKDQSFHILCQNQNSVLLRILCHKCGVLSYLHVNYLSKLFIWSDNPKHRMPVTVAMLEWLYGGFTQMNQLHYVYLHILSVPFTQPLGQKDIKKLIPIMKCSVIAKGQHRHRQLCTHNYIHDTVSKYQIRITRFSRPSVIGEDTCARDVTEWGKNTRRFTSKAGAWFNI